MLDFHPAAWSAGNLRSCRAGRQGDQDRTAAGRRRNAARQPKWGKSNVNFGCLTRKKGPPAESEEFLRAGPPSASARAGRCSGRGVSPGVMARLGLGASRSLAHHTRIIYCSHHRLWPERAQTVVWPGMISITSETPGCSLCRWGTCPSRPAAGAIADIGGGTYPAVMNIMLALFSNARYGPRALSRYCDVREPVCLDFWHTENGRDRYTACQWRRAPDRRIPALSLYPTRDGRLVAAAPLSRSFWEDSATLSGLMPICGTTAAIRSAPQAGAPRSLQRIAPRAGARALPAAIAAARSSQARRGTE